MTDGALEEARMIVLREMVLDHGWHEYAISDPFNTESRIQNLGSRLLDLIGMPKNVRVTTIHPERAGLEREGWDIPPEAA
jgi:hypothetical protein